MDLLELNDIYCKDKARIEHDRFFKDPVRVEYSFTPTEEHLLTTGDGRISAVVNKPFVGISSVMLNHSIKEFMSEIHVDTPLTDYLFGCNALICGDARFETIDERLQKYDECDLALGSNYHPDITFSDDVLGMTLVMDRYKNCNFELTKDRGGEDISAYSIDGIQEDGRSLSLVYVQEDNKKKFGYGGIIYTGRGLKSLCDELKIYLFSNTFIVGRSPEMKEFPERKTMKSSCVIIYEDSLKRIIETIGEEQ